jgi:hypothetical protein
MAVCPECQGQGKTPKCGTCDNACSITQRVPNPAKRGTTGAETAALTLPRGKTEGEESLLEVGGEALPGEAQAPESAEGQDPRVAEPPTQGGCGGEGDAVPVASQPIATSCVCTIL